MYEGVDFLKHFINSLREKKIIMASLRYKPYSQEMAFNGDYDFITAEGNIEIILATLFDLATENCVNFDINRIKYGKVAIRIYNSYDANSILLEIWSYLDVDYPKSLGYILWEDILKEIVFDREKGYRLSLDFEALYYIAHLHSKKKDLSHEMVQMRLHYYLEALKEENSQLVPLYETVLNEKNALERVSVTVNEMLIERSLLYTKANRDKLAQVREIRLKRAKRRIYTQIVRKIKIIPVVGPDGVGKTSIIEALQQKMHSKIKYYRFKSLFRHSLMYKLLSLFLRKKSQEKIPKNQYDDRNGEWLLRIASLRYPFLVVATFLSQKFYFSDRFFQDLLIQDSRFLEKEARLRENWRELLPLIPKSFWFIHLDAPTDIILSRKDELNAGAIEAYRRYIFQIYLEKPSLLYSYVNTSLELQQCVAPLLKSSKLIGMR